MFIVIKRHMYEATSDGSYNGACLSVKMFLKHYNIYLFIFQQQQQQQFGGANPLLFFLRKKLTFHTHSNWNVQRNSLLDSLSMMAKFSVAERM